MTRKIQFRLWDKQGVYGMLRPENFGVMRLRDNAYIAIDLDGGVMKFTPEGPTDVSDEYEVQQFTGLKDKNGKEIYEGDIVDVNDGERLQVIEFDDDVETDGYGRAAGWMIWEGKDSPNYVVVGNIYENPELLGGNND